VLFGSIRDPGLLRTGDIGPVADWSNTTMNTVYDDLLKEVTDTLERKVLTTFLEHPGAKLLRQYLVMHIFGYWPENLTNNKDDRKIRVAIERLRKSWPLVSSSGCGGYRLSEDVDEINAFAAEMASRAARATEKARQAHSWVEQARRVAEVRRTGVQVTQERLI
jgi:hypothetical protein